MTFTKSRISLLVIATAIVAFIVAWDWNWLRRPLENYVFTRTGRHLYIEGGLHVRLGLAPVIRIGKLRYENAAWAKEPQMASADEVEFVPKLLTLFRGPLVVERVRAVNPEVLLERSADGRRNWIFTREDDADRPGPEIRSLSISDGVLRWDDATRALKATLDIRTVDPAAALPVGSTRVSRLPTAIAFSGSYQGVAFKGTARTGDVLSLQNNGVPFPLNGKARIGLTDVEVDGTFADLAKLSGADARLKVSGPDWARLYPVLPLPLPASPPFSVEGRFRNYGGKFTYEGFSGTVGASDLSGDAEYTPASPRAHLKATLRSRILDLNDLGPLVGAKDSGKEDAKSGVNAESASDAVTIPPAASTAGAAAVRAARARPFAGRAVKSAAKGQGLAARPGKVFPDETFSRERLNAIDADVTLRASKINRPDALALENLSVILKLKGGVLDLEPLDFGFGGGKIVASVRLDARVDPIAARITLALRALKVDQVFPTVKVMQGSSGKLGGLVELSGRGNSVAQALGTAAGSARFAMSGGEISNLLLEIVGLDGGEILKFLIEGDRKVAVRCGIGDFDVKDGAAQARTLVFDTTDTRIDGEGRISLRDETLDLTLKPHPKDRSILVLRSPIHFVGTFAQPSYQIDKRGFAERVGGAVLLGLVNPLAALIPLVETGGGTDADCAALLDTVNAARREAAKPLVQEKRAAGR